MSSDRCAFLRPVVIDTTNNNASVDGHAITLTSGTYPHVGPVIHELVTKGIAAGGPASLAAAISTSGVVTLSASVTFSVTWTDAPLRDLLGYSGNLSSASSYAASYSVQNAWFPSRSRADNGDWRNDAKAQWRGVESRTGDIVGLRSGVTSYRMSISFDALNAYEVLYSRGTTAYQQVRSLDYFSTLSREVWGEIGQPSPSGFYFYPDASAIDLTVHSASYDSGDAGNMSYVSSPEVYVFAQFDADWYPNGSATLPIRSDYYGIELDIHSATAPTWTGA